MCIYAVKIERPEKVRKKHLGGGLAVSDQIILAM
jgi:hypothetical protein